MLDMNILLENKYFNGSTFTDNKIALGQPAFNTASITLDTDDFIYIGYFKPIQQVFLDIPTPNTNSSTTLLEFWNGTAWTTVDDIDGTLNLTRSGLIQWEPLTDWTANEVDGDEQFWLRISTDTLHTAATFNFIGLILADDNDLIIQVPYILDSALLAGESSHFKSHIAAREMIMQRLLNRGYVKIDENDDRQSINAWDLLDITEVRLGATQLALYYIYFNASDDPEDNWIAKANKFKDMYEQHINVARLSIDLDDDGILDDFENKARTKIVRMFR